MTGLALQADFERLQGRVWPARELWAEVKRIHEENLHTLAPELKTEDIWNYARRNSWIQGPTGHGWFVVVRPGDGGAVLRAR